jgi:hypothetical protein
VQQPVSPVEPSIMQEVQHQYAGQHVADLQHDTARRSTSSAHSGSQPVGPVEPSIMQEIQHQYAGQHVADLQHNTAWRSTPSAHRGGQPVGPVEPHIMQEIQHQYVANLQHATAQRSTTRPQHREHVSVCCQPHGGRCGMHCCFLYMPSRTVRFRHTGLCCSHYEQYCHCSTSLAAAAMVPWPAPHLLTSEP